MAGARGLEPGTNGFGDRRESFLCVTPVISRLYSHFRSGKCNGYIKSITYSQPTVNLQ